MLAKKGEVKLSLSTRQRRIGGADVQLHSFLNSAIDGGAWTAIRQEGGWATEPVWTLWTREISRAAVEITSFGLSTLQPPRNTDCATPAPK